MAEDKMPAFRTVDTDGHERRLQHLEENVGNLKTDVAENALTIKYVAKDVHDGFNGFSQQLASGFSDIKASLMEGESRMNAMSERIGEHGRKFDKLDEEKRKRSEKWDSWKKLIIAVATGALAIGLKELMVFMVHHL